METYSVVCLDISVRYFSFVRPTAQLPWARLPSHPCWHLLLTLQAATNSYQRRFLVPWHFSIFSVYPWCSCVSTLIRWSCKSNLSRTALSFTAITDAANAAGRLSAVFEADILEKSYKTNEDLPAAIEVKGATFTWDTPDEPDRKNKTKKQSRLSSHSSKGNAKAEAATISVNEKSQVEKARLQTEDRIFQVREISMEVPRGKLVAIVGPVGGGKTSLLQGLIGEMRKTSGSITFGGSVGYCPQSAWIQVGVGFIPSECRLNINLECYY